MRIGAKIAHRDGMNEHVLDAPLINFGDLPEAVDELLQRGVAAHRSDRDEADALFREALALAPQELPTYYCLYKINTYRGSLDAAAEYAQLGLREAARQAGWSEDPADWPRNEHGAGPARFAMFTLKALAFIELKRDNRDIAAQHLAQLKLLDPFGHVGWTVISDMFQALS
jgi:tetratricopeptide (TPR) repeat protein